MINLILYGILGFITYKTLAKPGATNPVSNVRSQQPIQPGYAGTIQINTPSTSSQGPTSGANKIAGNANQPWYTGPLVTGAGMATQQMVKGLSGLFSPSASSPPPLESADNGPEVDEGDLEQVQEDMAQSSGSATDNNEVAGADESYDESGDNSGDAGTEEMYA